MDAQDILDGKFFNSPSRAETMTSNQSFGPNDLFIAVMGITGSGKSTFISQCTNRPVEIGHGLKSKTSVLEIFPVQYGDKTVHLIDTPGFDDTYRKDIEILEEVSYWLSKSYKEQDIQLTGIVYLHRITDTRFGGQAMKDLRMFKQLCGDESFKSVVLATTMWGNITDTETGDRRVKELSDSADFYGSMIAHGAKMMRHENNTKSAMAIVEYLVQEGGGRTVLNIQKEIADKGAQLIETSAGKVVDDEISKQTEIFAEKLKDIEKRIEAATRDKDDKRAAELASARSELQMAKDEAEKSREELKIGMKDLFEKKEAEFQEAMKKMEVEREEKAKEIIEKEKELKQWTESLKKAEELHAAKKKAQEEEILQKEQELEEKQKLDAAINNISQVLLGALAQEIEASEEENRRREQNLIRARKEEERRIKELRDTEQAARQATAAENQRPLRYTGKPPSYTPYPENQSSPQGSPQASPQASYPPAVQPQAFAPPMPVPNPYFPAPFAPQQYGQPQYGPPQYYPPPYNAYPPPQSHSSETGWATAGALGGAAMAATMCTIM